MTGVPESNPSDTRDGALLDAAVSVFARYGYRKTSMHEVARAAGISRQGVYLRFAAKVDLCRKAVAHKRENQLRAVILALADPDRDVAGRLTAACDEWSGRYIGLSGADAADLMCASTALAGATLSHYERRFEEALEQAIARSPVHAVCDLARVAPHELAQALHATARGLKQLCKTRPEFQRGIEATVRLLCLPLTHNGGQSPAGST